MEWYDDIADGSWGSRFRITNILYRDTTPHQDLIIFENPFFGRMLGLDGILQTSQRDEFIYHETIAHTPIFAHGNVADVLIIGGGDGGTLEEVLKHDSVAHVTIVEIDRTVIDLCLEYLPDISNGAFDDPRTELVIADGCAFVADTERRFDVIIVDSSDPVGPSEVLFTERFYGDCRRCLKDGGILVTQTSYQSIRFDELRQVRSRLQPHFADTGFFHAVVPSYPSGDLVLSWASQDAKYRQTPIDVLAARFDTAGIDTRYYAPDMHIATFVMPRALARSLA